MQLTKSLLVDAAIILGLILVGVVGYKLSPLLLPQADMTLQPAPGCNLHEKACAATLPEGGTVRLAVTPRPIPVTTPLEIVVELDGLPADRVSVDFAGVSMAMGFNRPVLVAAGAQRFVGQATLPVCVSGRMEWQATVLIESGRRRIAIPYRFESGH